MTAAGLLIGCNSAQRAEATLAMINGILIDGTGADAISKGAVVIRDGRVMAAWPRTSKDPLQREHYRRPGRNDPTGFYQRPCPRRL